MGIMKWVDASIEVKCLKIRHNFHWLILSQLGIHNLTQMNRLPGLPSMLPRLFFSDNAFDHSEGLRFLYTLLYTSRRLPLHYTQTIYGTNRKKCQTNSIGSWGWSYCKQYILPFQVIHTILDHRCSSTDSWLHPPKLSCLPDKLCSL